MPEPHDPGGKVRLALPPDVEAGAELSADGVHRYVLWRRRRGLFESERRILWVGMNPSTADADVDDPTCAKEQRYSQAWGFSHYRKVNVMSFRCTDSKQLRRLHREGVDLSPTCNFMAIAAEADSAEMIIACWGRLHRDIEGFAYDAWQYLRIRNREKVHCLGTNADGSPMHPLYLPGDANPVQFAWAKDWLAAVRP